MNPTNESIGRAFLSWCSDADSGFSRMIERIMRDARELDRQAPGEWVMTYRPGPTANLLDDYADECINQDFATIMREGATVIRELMAAPQPPATAGEVELADEAMKLADFFEGVRVFVTSRERIKRPEGEDLFDEHVTRLLRLAGSLRKLTRPAVPEDVAQDAERMTWLENADYRGEIKITFDSPAVLAITGVPTIRDCIDAAIAASKGDGNG